MTKGIYRIWEVNTPKELIIENVERQKIHY